MKQIKIPFDTYYDTWQSIIIDTLNENDIIYNKELPSIICRSLKHTINKKLREWYYKPRDTLYYRQSLIKKLKKQGLNLQIQSNRILWKYLEYFTDVEDYSLCFDIEIVIEDFEKATENIIFVNVLNEDKNAFAINTNLNNDNNKSIEESISALNSYRTKYPFIQDLVNIIQNMLERS